MSQHLRCSICKEIFEDPVQHNPCGKTFDRKCLTDTCPTETCQRSIRNEDLTTNYSCKQMADEYRASQETIYHLILIDTSSSMRYSDQWFPFIFGESRLKNAVTFLEHWFRSKLNVANEKFALVAFDVSQRIMFPFETITETHINSLKTLKADGAKTALFDALSFAERMIGDLDARISARSLPVHLIVLTDGANNYGSDCASTSLSELHQKRKKRLHLLGHILQIGDRNLEESIVLSKHLKYRYHHFRRGGGGACASAFGMELARENETVRAQLRSNVSRVTERLTQSSGTAVSDNSTFEMINLPEVPSHPIELSRVPDRRELAD